MSSINFDNVWLLFIAIPLVVLFLVPFFIAIRKDNVNGHNIASVVLHVLMAVIIAFAAAGTQIVTVVTETDVYVVADVSYSAEKNLDTIDGYIKNLSLPKNSKLGVICFGKDYKISTALGKTFRTVKNSGVDDSETNISEALEYAGTLFKDDVIKRIVLITDGKETYPEDANKLKRTVDGLAAKKIKVDAIYLDDNISSDTREVQISSAEYTNTAYINHNETVNVNIQTNLETGAKSITLYKDGEVYSTIENKKLALGTNNITFYLDTSEAGTFDYKVVVDPEDDECEFNNSYSFTQTVSEVVNVLLISSNQSDLEYVRTLYDENTEIDSYINNPDIPVSVEELARYDEILISDITVASLNNYELFIESLDIVVSQFGKSLLTFGDLGIQSSVEGDVSKLNSILPIKYATVIGAPKLYTILIDVSHSMLSTGKGRFNLAKLAAIQLVNFLNDEDYVRVMTFSGSAKPLFYGRVGPSRDEIVSDIKSLTTEQGTYLGLGLQAVREMITGGDFSEKQVMVITDGMPFEGTINYGDEDYAGLTDKQAAEREIQIMSLYGIQTSIMQVGGDSGVDDTKADIEWLKGLAAAGGGTFYPVENEVQLATVNFGDYNKNDAPDISNTWITASRPRDEALTDVDISLAYVSDYVPGKADPLDTVLTVTYQVGKVTADVPLYAYCSYGNGKTASYSGKLNEIKKRDGSNINDDFFGNIISNLMPAEKVDYPYTLKTELDGKIAKITITPAELHAKATAQISVLTPDGEEYTEAMIFDSSSYYFTIKASEIGKYDIGVVYSYNGSEYFADATFNLSYEPEYDAFATFEASVLYKMIGANGTVSEDGKLALVNDKSEVASYTIKLTVPLLIIAVVLYVADIAIRKLKWKDIVSLFGKARGKNGGKK